MDDALRLYYLQQMGIDTWHLRDNRIGVKLMVIGDALTTPNTLLRAMLKSIGLVDEDVYIADVKEDTTFESLTKQIAEMKPRIIIAAGQAACLILFNRELSNLKVVSSIHDYQGIPVVVSYHPAHLLQHRLDKKKAYQDLLSTQQLLLHCK